MRCQLLCSERYPGGNYYGLQGEKCLCDGAESATVSLSELNKLDEDRCDTRCERSKMSEGGVPQPNEDVIQPIGCYLESAKDPDMKFEAAASAPVMNPEVCSEMCKGYLFFGIMAPNTCRCGNSYGKKGHADEDALKGIFKVGEGCDDTCPQTSLSTSSVLCGGKLAASVYAQKPSWLGIKGEHADTADGEQPLTCGSRWPGWISNDPSAIVVASTNTGGPAEVRHAFTATTSEARTAWRDISVDMQDGSSVTLDFGETFHLSRVAIRAGTDTDALREKVENALAYWELEVSTMGYDGPWKLRANGTGGCDRKDMAYRGRIFKLGEEIAARWVRLSFFGSKKKNGDNNNQCFVASAEPVRLRANGVQFFGIPKVVHDERESDNTEVISNGAITLFGRENLKTPLVAGTFGMNETEPGPVSALDHEPEQGRVVVKWRTPDFRGWRLSCEIVRV